MPKRESSLAIDALVKRLVLDIQNNTIADASGKLPSEPELMVHYQVTRYTLREALMQLSNMGYTYQAHGIGTFVRQRADDSLLAIQNAVGLTAEFARQNKQLITKSATIEPISLADAEFVPSGSELPQDTPLWSVKRLRYLDDAPFIYERSYYLQALIGDIPESALYGSLFNFIEDQENLKLGFQDKIVTADALTKATGEFFKQPVGTPVLCIRDDSYLSAGQLFAFSKLTCAASLTRLFMFKKL